MKFKKYKYSFSMYGAGRMNYRHEVIGVFLNVGPWLFQATWK